MPKRTHSEIIAAAESPKKRGRPSKWLNNKRAILQAFADSPQNDPKLTELASLDLPHYTENMVKHLTRIGLTHFRRRDSLSLVTLLSLMSQLQEDRGYVWADLTTFFLDVSVSHAVKAAERGDDSNFAMFERLIHDFFPLMDCAEDRENCKFKAVPFETVATLLALEK